ncbi:MAG: ChbG/HpnK family deacetylase [Acidobacteriota bacterium]
MKRLIVNADDFGFTRGTNAGIVRAFKNGILTSTTLMANGAAFQEAVDLAQAHPMLGVGCHLTAVGGKAVSSESASLADTEGNLPRTLTDLVIKLARRQVNPLDIEREFAAQVERLVSTGIRPTHLDTHKHTAMHPTVSEAMARVATEFGIRIVRFPFENPRVSVKTALTRNRRKLVFKQGALSLMTRPAARQFKNVLRRFNLQTPDYFCGVTLTGLLDSEALCQIINSLNEGVTELMCHPAIYDAELEVAHTRLKRERQQEFEALTDATVKHCLEANRIELLHYGQI